MRPTKQLKKFEFNRVECVIYTTTWDGDRWSCTFIKHYRIAATACAVAIYAQYFSGGSNSQ
jgi:hypothetical protein